MLNALLSLILNLFGTIIEYLFSVLNFPALPPEFVLIMAQILDIIRSGLGILNFIFPFELVVFCIDFWFSIFIIKESYIVMMWVLRKTPFIGVK